MASIESRIDTFITEHEIDPLMKDDICVLVTGCMEDLFKHVFSTAVPETEKKAKKVTKAEKIDDPTTCTSRDEIYKCTVGILNQYCKDKAIKVGGNKAALIDRVWRHLQGETTEDDKSAKTKPKTTKKTAEKHECCGCTAKGAPCGTGGTEEREGLWFCWRHITEANEIIAQKKGSKPSEPEPEEITPAEKQEKPKGKKPKAKPSKQELVEEN
jgi:hypothetical protein